MTYQIADAKTRYFNDKEHYINFRNVWSKAVNSVNAKSTKNQFYGNKEPGWLDSRHMLLYAILRGVDAETAFTPITKKVKLDNGSYVNNGIYNAYISLRRLSSKYMVKTYVDKFLAPFAGTIDTDILVKVIEDLPEIKPVTL